MLAPESRATRFCGRGRDGEELNGSNAGSKVAGRFMPATETAELFLGGEDDSMLWCTRMKRSREQWPHTSSTKGETNYYFQASRERYRGQRLASRSLHKQ